jgi:hypothetical protein
MEVGSSVGFIHELSGVSASSRVAGVEEGTYGGSSNYTSHYITKWL